MTRPAIIIGLGGTGQWVVTLMKKNLLENEANFGRMPDNVRLLAFDTMPETQGTANTAVNDPGDVSREKEVAVGSVKLDPNREFFGLSGNAKKIGDSVVKGESGHIGRWFDAKFYREHAAPSLWDLATGAAALRQFGRLALFMQIDNIVWNAIRKAYMDVRTHAGKGNELEVIIVASFAGGTGAGMFIDLGIICRSLANLVNNNLIIRGFFVLPRPFIGSGSAGLKDSHTRARSFAAWRELDRFMNVSQEYGSPTVVYDPRNRNLSVQLDSRPFDQCYLVDSKRPNNTLEHAQPVEGVFPAVANFINAILDWKAGTIYALDSTNRDSLSTVTRRSVGYTAFGAYSVRAPIHYALQEYSLSFADDLVKQWLVPEQDENKRLIGLSPNANREAGYGTKRGAHEASELLLNQNGVAVQNTGNGVTAVGSIVQSVRGTAFLSRISDIFNNQRKEDGVSVLNDAQGGYTLLLEGEVNPNTYAGIYGTLPTDANTTRVIYQNKEQTLNPSELGMELKANIWTSVPPSKEMNEPPANGPARFDQDIPKFENDHFGVGKHRGLYGQTLDQIHLFQVARFKQMLHQWMLNTLNGTSNDNLTKLSGKLGYANDFCNQLVKIMDYFVGYLDTVQQKRNSLQMQNSQIEYVKAAREDMINHCNDKCIFFFEHPRAHIKQREYLGAVDDLHTMRKDDMLLATMRLTGLEMRKIAQEAAESTTSWIRSLVMGTDSTVGAYRSISSLLGDTKAIRQADQKAVIVQKLLHMAPYDKFSPVFIQAELEKALGRFRWEVDTREGFSIRCFATVPEVQEDESHNKVYRDVVKEFSLFDTHMSNQSNSDILIKIGRYVFREESAKHRIIDEVMRLKEPNYSDPHIFGTELMDRSEPLVDLNVGSVSHSFLIKNMYLRMNTRYAGVTPEVTDYSKRLDDWMKEHHGLPNTTDYQMVPSEDEHEITLIRVLDNLQDNDFSIYEDLAKAYREHILSSSDVENAARLHIFPNECNAAAYESKISKLLSHRNRGLRTFHPRVVMLLEDSERASLFFRCQAYGFIKQAKTQDDAGYYYLDIPARGDYVAQRLTLTTTVDRKGQHRRGAPTTFEVMNSFVNVGCDVNVAENQIVWSHLSNAVRLYENDLRRSGKLQDILKAEIDTGLVATLRARQKEEYAEGIKANPKLAESTSGFDWKPGQDYDDLADLAEMIYLEVLQNREAEMTQRETYSA
jgi:hypothetical protein